MLFAFSDMDAAAAAVVIAANDYDDTDAVMLLLGQTENHLRLKSLLGEKYLSYNA